MSFILHLPPKVYDILVLLRIESFLFLRSGRNTKNMSKLNDTILLVLRLPVKESVRISFAQYVSLDDNWGPQH